jgi:predicted nucleotidyltransferase
MRRDPVLAAALRRMRTKDGCHTAILYGSRARGDHGPGSDYDLLGIRRGGRETSWAARSRGRYVDVFVWPERKVARADASMLHLRDGVVLFEKGDAGRRLVARLRRIDAAGPKPPDRAEANRRRVWARKMLGRVRRGGLLGQYRRASLVFTLLEDWFFFRRRWYRGPREALAHLASADPATHRLFARVLRSADDRQGLAALVRRVTEPRGKAASAYARVRPRGASVVRGGRGAMLAAESRAEAVGTAR